MKKKKSVEDKVLIVSSILLVLTLISIFLLGKELIKQTNEANNNPDSYRIIVSIKNNVVQDTTIFVKKNDVPYSYLGKNKNDKKKQYKKINDFMTNSILQLTQEKKVPESFSEIISGWNNKPVTVSVVVENTAVVTKTKCVRYGDEYRPKDYQEEELISKENFKQTFKTKEESK